MLTFSTVVSQVAGVRLFDRRLHRTKIGVDVAIEALRDYLARRNRDLDELLRLAAVCRVANVMRPYLEALL